MERTTCDLFVEDIELEDHRDKYIKYCNTSRQGNMTYRYN